MVSCAIICKNEEKNLERLLPKLKPHVDEIVVVDTGSTDKSIEIARKYANVYEREWKDFSDARNFSFAKCTHKYVFWIDCDDDIEGAENLRKLAEQAERTGMAGWGFKYNYAVDENGNVLSVQWRERLLDKTQFEWLGKIHESACQTTKNPVHRSDEVVINHLATLEDMKKSNLRNLEMLLDEHKQDKEKTDPRTLYYIAQTYKGLKDWVNAAKFYTLYIPTSGWDEEKAQAWHSLADCLRFMDKFNEAIIADMECLKILPDWPDGYLGIADTYFHKADHTSSKKDWEACVEWLKAGFTKKVPDTIRVIEPQRYTWMPTLQMAIAYLNLGKVFKSYDLYKKAYSLSKGAEFVAKYFGLFEEYKEREIAIQGLLDYVEFAKTDKKVLNDLSKIITPKLLDDERVLRLKTLYTPPQVWGDKEITIFCPFGYEDWADPSVINGIGGSEEAVVYLSREFTKQGYKVTVFNTCGNLAGEYRGVTYKPLYEFNPNDTFNIFISWRSPLPLKNIKAKVRWAWIHDVPLNPEKEYSEEVLKNVDKVVVLSKYHRSLIPMVPDEKVLISNNGIVPEQFEDLPEKKPHTIFWGSSYDRGLHCLLRDIMPIVKKEIPDVKLHVCYGWNTFLKMNENNPVAMSWKEEMDKLMSQGFIAHHGRVGHKQLAKIMGECTVWAYPTEFDEINCITAQKAQCAGCVPVTTDRAALNETNVQGFHIYGHKIYTSTVQQKDFAKKVIKQLKTPKKIDVKKAIKDFSWERTAKQWISEWNA